MPLASANEGEKMTPLRRSRSRIAVVTALIMGLSSSLAPTFAAAAPAKPKDEVAFLKVIATSKKAYEDADTDLQSANALRLRDKKLCSLVKSGKFTNWVGTISSVGANREGKAHVEVRIAENVRLVTWNNAFSDSSDNTLIPPDTPVFNALLPAKKGDTVVVSGKFVSDGSNCIKGANLTRIFYAIDPQILVRFTALKRK